MSGYFQLMGRCLVAMAVALASISPGGSLAADALACPAVNGWTQLTFPEPSGAPDSAAQERQYVEHAKYGAKHLAQSWQQATTILVGGSFGLYRSSDCGASWTRLPYPTGPDSGYTQWEQQPPDIATTEPFRTFAPVGISPTGRLFFARPMNRFWLSDDDGQSWQPVGFPGWTNHLVFGPQGTAWMSATESGRGGPDYPWIAMSSDNGKTWWTKRDLTSPLSVRIFTVDPIDESVLIIGREDGRITTSRDGGTTERDVARFTGPIRAVGSSLDGRTLWVATGDDVLQFSGDEGRSWRSIPEVPGRIQRNGLHVNHEDAGAVFALTDRGELWYFRDSAVTSPAQLP